MKNSSREQTVLVTGGSGFIASYCIIALLEAGFRVRATLRSLKRSVDVQATLREGGVRVFDSLSFVEADLEKDHGWAEAVSGCNYVLHIASPTPGHAGSEEAFVQPAVKGVLRVLAAARDAGVRRVVLTSAFGAVGFGTNKSTPYTEQDWTDLSKDIPWYQKSKTLAEKAAWDFIAREGNGLELAAINPVGVLGPVLSADYTHSIQTIHRMLNGELSGCPKISSGYIDVRDVADLHVKAMILPQANGERFIAAGAGVMSIMDIARILRSRLGDAGQKAPVRELPNWFMRILGRFNPSVKVILPYLGMNMHVSNEKARTLLGWNPRANEQAVVDTAESLIRLNLVK